MKNNINQEEDIKTYDKIAESMRDIYVRKNSDYGSSITDTYNKYGLVSFLVKMQDKINRVSTLIKKDSMVKDEKIEDSLMDLANYSMLAIIELRRDKKETCKSEEVL